MSECKYCNGYKNEITSLENELKELNNSYKENLYLKNQNEQLLNVNEEQSRLADYWQQKYIDMREMYRNSVTR